MRSKIRNPRFTRGFILCFILFVFCAKTALGAAVTGSGSTVVLSITAEAQWGANGLQVNQSTGSVTGEVAVAADGSGGIFLAWRDTRNTADGEIYAARVNSSGSLLWEKKIENNPGGIVFQDPQIVKSVSGGAVDGVIVAYVKDSGGDDIYVKKLTASSGADAWPAGSVALYTDVTVQDQVRLVGDQAGGAVFVWRDYRGGNSGIYAQKLDSSGLAEWATNGVTVCASAVAAVNTNANLPQVAALNQANDEGYLIAWLDERDGYNNIYAQRISSGGNPDTAHFGTDGAPVSASSVEKGEFQMVNALTYNGAILAWEEGTGSSQDIYGQLIQGDATRWFGNSGVALSTASGQQTTPRLAALPSYESIVSWFDNDTLQGHVQKLNTSGTATWGAGGKELSGAPIGNLAYDGAGGAYAVTYGGSLGAIMPYAQRINSSGGELWGNGIQVAPYVLPDLYNLLVIASEGSAAIVAWVDGRNGNKDLFAQKFSQTAADATSPEVQSVKVDGVELLSGDHVSASPVIDVVVTDNNRLTSAAVKLDGNPLALTYVSTSAARWDLRATPTVTAGDHTLQVTAADANGNPAAVSYAISRAASSGVAGGAVKALASGKQLTVAYELTASAKVRIEVRDITGRKVKEVMIDAGLTGGAAGYNEVNIDAGDLGVGVYLIYVAPVGGTPSVGKFSISQ